MLSKVPRKQTWSHYDRYPKHRIWQIVNGSLAEMAFRGVYWSEIGRGLDSKAPGKAARVDLVLVIADDWTVPSRRLTRVDRLLSGALQRR